MGLKKIILVVILFLGGSFFLFLYFSSQISVSNFISPLRYDSAFVANNIKEQQQKFKEENVAVYKDVYFNPSQLDLPYIDFVIAINLTDTLKGWYIKQDKTDDAATILILHDIAESKILYLNHAHTLFNLGFNICLIDLPAHGVSGGENYFTGNTIIVSAVLDSLFCFYETNTVSALAMGFSAFPVALNLINDNRLQSVILQNPVNKTEDVLHKKVEEQWNGISSLIYPLAKQRFKHKTGFEVDSLNLSELVKRTNKPILIAITDSATEIQANDALAVYDSCKSPTKKIWTSKSRGFITSMFDAENNYFRAVAAFINSSIPKTNNTKRNKRKIVSSE